jgi:hypothetical protein
MNESPEKFVLIIIETKRVVYYTSQCNLLRIIVMWNKQMKDGRKEEEKIEEMKEVERKGGYKA